MTNPMLVRSLTLVATPVLNSPRAEAHQVSFPSADLPLTDGATFPTSIPTTPSLPRRAVGPVPAVVLGSSEGWTVEDNGPDGARQIRRRLQRVLETRP
jgi:hypothetical protein